MDLNDIVVFTKVVETKSFTGAAEQLGLPKSTVSRKLAQLEERLGVRLVQRTTRKLALTDLGEAYYERASRIVADLAAAEQVVMDMQATPRGRLRVTAPIDLSALYLGRIIADFNVANPEVYVELDGTDRVVDLIEEGFDVGIRFGPLPESTLIAKKLGESRMIRLASPAYLKKHGRPRTIDELARHRCLGFLDGGRPRPFTFVDDHGTRSVEVNGPCHVNDGAVLGLLAAQGHGIITLFDFMANEWIERGELVPILEDVGETSWPIHALYPRNRHLVPKVGVVLDHLAESFGAPPRRRRSGGR